MTFKKIEIRLRTRPDVLVLDNPIGFGLSPENGFFVVENNDKTILIAPHDIESVTLEKSKIISVTQ